MNRIKIRLFCFLMFPAFLNAQTVLSLRNAIDSTLKNSFDIQIAENNLLISQKYNSYGVAGAMPYFGLSATGNKAINDIFQSYSTGTETDLKSVNQNNVNASADMGITLFNGFKIKATKERLSLLEKQNEYKLNNEIQTAIAVTMIKFYDIIRQQQYLKIMQQLLEVSEKKLEIINTKKGVGMASGVDIMQAELDVNTARENVKQQQLLLEHSKSDLLVAMSSKTMYSFNITDSIIVSRRSDINPDSLKVILKENPMYLSVMQQTLISEKLAKESAANLYPSLKLNASYDYLVNDNSAGNMLLSRINGPSAGLTVQIPLYYGGNYRVQREAAIIGISNARLIEENTLLTLEANAYKLYLTYIKNIEQAEEQKKSHEMAGKLVDLVMQNFELNKATILEVKAAQATYENSAFMLVNLQYSAKTAEIQLLALMYKLN